MIVGEKGGKEETGAKERRVSILFPFSSFLSFSVLLFNLSPERLERQR
jgi:hypothetical protein